MAWGNVVCCRYWLAKREDGEKEREKAQKKISKPVSSWFRTKGEHDVRKKRKVIWQKGERKQQKNSCWLQVGVMHATRFEVEIESKERESEIWFTSDSYCRTLYLIKEEKKNREFVCPNSMRFVCWLRGVTMTMMSSLHVVCVVPFSLLCQDSRASP